MSSSDIKPRGAGEGKYWVKRPPAMGGVGTLRLVVIDEFGRVESTPLGMPWDDAAMTEDEAIQHHLRRRRSHHRHSTAQRRGSSTTRPWRSISLVVGSRHPDDPPCG